MSRKAHANMQEDAPTRLSEVVRVQRHKYAGKNADTQASIHENEDRKAHAIKNLGLRLAPPKKGLSLLAPQVCQTE